MSGAKVLGRFVAAVGAVAFLACGGETPGITDPKVDTTKTTVDTAVANAAARTKSTNTLLTQINDAITAMGQSAGAGGASPPPPPAAGGIVVGGTANTSDAPPADAGKCSFDSTAVRWNCPDFTQKNGLIVKSWFQFLDAESKPHKFIDSTKTTAIRRFVGSSGVIQSQLGTSSGPVPQTDTTNDADTLLLAGLKGPPADRKLTSSGLLKHVLVPEGRPVARISAIKTTQDFKFDPPGPNGEPPARRYPIAGKITLVLTSSQDGVANSTATTTQVTTYDGTAIAKLVITNLQGTVIRTCTYDMTNATVPASCK